MKISDVKIGMRLRSTLNELSSPITVTAITPDSFQYSLDAERPFWHRDIVLVRHGHECHAQAGELPYEPAL